MYPRVFFLTLLISYAAGLHAQDAQYWNFQFGAKSALLGGAVIGSVDDISAVYYNPGALSLIEDPAFTVSANVFEYSTIRLVDNEGQGIDLGTNNTGVRPSLIAGTIGQDILGEGGVLSYSALTRQSGSFDLKGTIVTDDPETFPGLDYDEFTSLARYDGTLNDLWVGLTYSRPLSEHVGVGLSWYNALRSQRQWRESNVTLVNRSEDDISTNYEARGGNFFAARILFKAGISFNWDKLTVGLNLTTPGLHLFGNGNLGTTESFVSTDSTYLASNTQNKVKAKYKSPLSIGAGIGWRLSKLHIHASAEWFAGIDAYEVMRGEDWETQEPKGEPRSSVSIHEQGSVFNWGLGLQYALKNSSLYGSYFVDNSVRTDIDARSDLTVSPVDINNVSLGTDFTFKRTRIDLGLGFAWGSSPNEELSDLIQGTDRDVEVRYTYRSFRLLFGIEIGSKEQHE